MNNIKVEVQWNTVFSTLEEVEKFKHLLSEVYDKMFHTDSVDNTVLIDDGFYEKGDNSIYIEVDDQRKDPNNFEVGNVVHIKGNPKSSPDYSGRIDYIKDDGMIFVSNVGMPFTGSICKYFYPYELEHL